MEYLMMSEKLFKAFLSNHFKNYSPMLDDSDPSSFEAHKSWSKINAIVTSLPELKPVMDDYIQFVFGVKGWVAPKVEEKPVSTVSTLTMHVELEIENEDISDPDLSGGDKDLRNFLRGVGVYKVIFRKRGDGRIREMNCIKNTEEDVILNERELKHQLYSVTDVDINEHRNIPMDGIITMMRIDI